MSNMKTIDISLFEGSPFCIKTKSKRNIEGKEYVIDFVDAVDEIKLMQQQEEIISKSSKWKDICQQDVDKWRKLLIEIIRKNDSEINEKDINLFSPIQLIGVLMALISHLQEKSNIIYEGLSPEVKEEVNKITEDVKKKKIEKALLESQE